MAISLCKNATKLNEMQLANKNNAKRVFEKQTEPEQ